VLGERGLAKFCTDQEANIIEQLACKERPKCRPNHSDIVIVNPVGFRLEPSCVSPGLALAYDSEVDMLAVQWYEV
jgi:hypothetical protein